MLGNHYFYFLPFQTVITAFTQLLSTLLPDIKTVKLYEALPSTKAIIFNEAAMNLGAVEISAKETKTYNGNNNKAQTMVPYISNGQ